MPSKRFRLEPIERIKRPQHRFHVFGRGQEISKRQLFTFPTSLSLLLKRERPGRQEESMRKHVILDAPASF